MFSSCNFTRSQLIQVLKYCSINSSIELAKHLIHTYDLDVNNLSLKKAVKNKHIEMVKYIVDCGVAYDFIVLEKAAFSQVFRITKYLVKHNKDLLKRGDLIYLLSNLKIVKLLIKYGMDPNAGIFFTCKRYQYI